MPIPFYRCERCNREYPTEEKALACERSHLQVVSVRIKQYSIWKHRLCWKSHLTMVLLKITLLITCTKEEIRDEDD